MFRPICSVNTPHVRDCLSLIICIDFISTKTIYACDVEVITPPRNTWTVIKQKEGIGITFQKPGMMTITNFQALSTTVSRFRLPKLGQSHYDTTDLDYMVLCKVIGFERIIYAVDLGDIGISQM